MVFCRSQAWITSSLYCFVWILTHLCSTVRSRQIGHELAFKGYGLEDIILFSLCHCPSFLITSHFESFFFPYIPKCIPLGFLSHSTLICLRSSQCISQIFIMTAFRLTTSNSSLMCGLSPWQGSVFSLRHPRWQGAHAYGGPKAPATVPGHRPLPGQAGGTGPTGWPGGCLLWCCDWYYLRCHRGRI